MVAFERSPSSWASRWMRSQAPASALCSQILSRTSGWKISAPPPGRLPRPASLNSASSSRVGLLVQVQAVVERQPGTGIDLLTDGGQAGVGGELDHGFGSVKTVDESTEF